MMRLVLFVFLICGVALAFASVMAALRAAGPASQSQSLPETRMPRPFRLIAFTLLMTLMVGVATGWLGAA